MKIDQDLLVVSKNQFFAMSFVLGLFLIVSVNEASSEEISTKEWIIPTPNSALHDTVVDKFDKGWFSMMGTYKVGKYDQQTREMTEHDLPSQTSIKFIHTDGNGNVWFPNYNNEIGVVLAAAQESQDVVSLKEQFEIKGTTMREDKDAPPPLWQVREGVRAADVACSDDFELVLKRSNGMPACIRLTSVAALIERGWAIHVLPDYDKNENNNSVTFSTGQYGIKTERVGYFQDADGYLARPAVEGKFPAIVMMHEWWGLNDNIKEMAEKLASHGYVVLAVDLYGGQVASTSEEARALIGSFEQQQWTDNMNSATQYLEEHFEPSSIGSIGWCFGGGQSLNLALNNQDMDATVIYYGQPVTDSSLMSAISWPVLGIFAGEDAGIPVKTVLEFESVLNELGIENEIIVYPGVDHAFANPSGDRYAPEAASDAWQKTLEFFDAKLR